MPNAAHDQNAPETRKPYKPPKLQDLGDLVQVTLPGGSKGAEGGSGKGRSA